jgi:cobalt/nickel transport protein
LRACGFIFFHVGFTPTCFAHFGMVIPSDSMIMQEDNRNVRMTLSFSHPFEMVGMELGKAQKF